MKNVTITAGIPIKYSTLFKIRKHQLKDHVQFWASCVKHEQTEKKVIGDSEKNLRSRKHDA